jgi:DnaK suppressor protein
MKTQKILHATNIDGSIIEDISEQPNLLNAQHANRLRYSDAELQEFKKLILNKLANARMDYELLTDSLTFRDDNGTNNTSHSFKLLEDAADTSAKEEAAQLAERQSKHIQHLEGALRRIENKTYGICKVTGRLIAKERLRSVPHTTLSIYAKLGQLNQN